MIFYFVILALGLYFIYALRDLLLVLQDRRDAKLAAERKCGEAITIIQQNCEQCKRFERAS